MTIPWEAVIRSALRIDAGPRRANHAAWVETVRQVLADADDPLPAGATHDVVAELEPEAEPSPAVAAVAPAGGVRDIEPSAMVGLAQRIADGDLVAFRVVFDAYFGRLYRYVHTYTRSWEAAEDLVHDVFLQLWTKRAKVGGVRRLDAYLYTMARRDALDYLKHRSVEARSAAEVGGSGPVWAPPHADEVETRDTLAALQRAIDSLPSRQREVILLRLEQLSYEEIAGKLGITRGAVAAHWHKAVQQLRRLLK